jgi:mycothiol synthase
MTDSIVIQNYRPSDLASLAALINEADAVDKNDRSITLEQLEHEMSFPTFHPETDSFLAWDGDRLIGFTELYVRESKADAVTMVCTSGVVHPRWRRRGLGRRLLEVAEKRAQYYAAQRDNGTVYFDCSARAGEQDRKALYTEMDMVPVRYFVNMARPLNGDLPPVRTPAGIRLRPFDPERDVETAWRVDTVAFRDHWGHTDGKLEEFEHWITMPHFRPELWWLAEDQASDQVVGLALNIIDPDWIALTGRQEGYVDTLAVLREHRKQGLGTALLAQSLHVLREAGMEAAHLHADAKNLTGAVRLYERAGFRIRKTGVAYRKTVSST